jgi:hypothetical protein
MPNDIRISGPHGVAPAKAPAPAAGKVSGSWHGQTITAAPPGAAQALAQTQEFLAKLPSIQRDLSSRRVSHAPIPGRTSAADIFHRAQAQGVDVRNVRAGARALLSGNKGVAGDKRDYSKTRFMALQLAAACLEDDANEDDVTAMLAPVREHAHKPQELAELLRRAAASDNDSEAFDHFREDVLAGLDTTSQDGEELVRKLRDGRVEDQEVMERLRKGLKIPTLNQLSVQKRLELRQKIQDEIADYASESTGQGKEVLANFNAASAAAGTDDAATFLKTYTDLVMVPHTLASAIKLLVLRYPIDALIRVVDTLKKALRDDLNAATPSHDKYWLGAVVSHLGNMSVLSSIIDSVNELIALIRRREQKEREEKRRGKRNGGDELDDEDEEKSKKVTGPLYGR